MHERVWLWLMLGVMGVTARYLPTPELVADSLMPFSPTIQDNARPKRDIEGSGDEEPLPLRPQLDKHFQRMTAPEDGDKNGEDLDEGSGSPPELALSHVDDSFAKEPGMVEVLEDLNKPEGLPKEDDNQQGNSLNVLPSEDPRPEEEEETAAESAIEGSGAEPEIKLHPSNITIINEDAEIINRTIEDLHVLHTTEHELVAETTVMSSIEQDEEESSTEGIVFHAHDNSEHSTEIPAEHQEPEENVDLETTESSPVTETSPLPATEFPILPPVEASSSLPLDVPSSPEPSTESSSTTEHTTPAPEEHSPSPMTITEEPAIHLPEEDTTPIVEPSEETISTTEISEVEILSNITGAIKSAAAPEEIKFGKSLASEEADATTMNASIVIGVLVIVFLSLTVFLVMRNRRRSNSTKPDEFHDEETSKALLSNGKYKPDNDDMKNNEISPLVINKFEKSPNLSSQKNINNMANEKNIEKDNVLKQAKIDDEEEKEENRKSAVEELKQDGEAEKVVVRSHIDLDSIPRKPLIVNRNGNTYHSIPNGESNT